MTHETFADLLDDTRILAKWMTKRYEAGRACDLHMQAGYDAGYLDTYTQERAQLEGRYNRIADMVAGLSQLFNSTWGEDTGHRMISIAYRYS